MIRINIIRLWNSPESTFTCDKIFETFGTSFQICVINTNSEIIMQHFLMINIEIIVFVAALPTSKHTNILKCIQ